MKIDLSNTSTEDLVIELLTRPDLVKKDGLLSKYLWELRVKLGKIVCVDSFAFRDNNGVIEVSAILRNTGPYAGKYCLIGGVVAIQESIEEALRRHWMTDLGCEIKLIDSWNKPYIVHQDIPPNSSGNVRPDFLPEPTKNNIGLVYPVEILNQPAKFGKTELGGQEASDFVWFSAKTLPSADMFAYGFGQIYKDFLEQH